MPGRRLSTEEPQKSHGGRHRQELLCGDPSHCWEGLLWRDVGLELGASVPSWLTGVLYGELWLFSGLLLT